MNFHSSSPTNRFLRQLKQPNSDSNPLELDESDVVWSPDSAGPNSPSPSPSTDSSPPSSLRLKFQPARLGLSSVLSDDRPTLLRRQSGLDPSFSATSAARTIPPVPIPRSGSSSGDSTGSGSGKFLMSAPVNVPAWPSNGVRRRRSDLDDSDDLEDDTKGEMLPPHEIVARSHVMTFSVVEGVGRTLKGRDLRRVRNAVFQKTGFID
ncbi:hypothetical protein AAG906_007075 [Vitis piasezkii]|uniref:uncharacterized protein LOC117933060 n=1 Tax=Vitis riparia TaxID=96939 RepID=UPI00155A2A83|nr:uncharacterized protein LOC117933060 [Vitis riparia]